MATLTEELHRPCESLEDFARVATRVLEYLPNVVSSSAEKNGYRIMASEVAGTKKYLRPVNQQLFLSDAKAFQEEYARFDALLVSMRDGERNPSMFDTGTIDSVVYTIQQSIGCGLDLLGDSNSARKHVGNRFEELLRFIFHRMGISNSHRVLNIPYETENGTKQYKCEIDLILSPYEEVRSTPQHLDPAEVVVSLKTTSKDRMGKIFMDKILLERFVDHPQKVIGIFLNDVQRKGKDSISFTLVSGLFMVYSEFITPMDGVYYIDPPPQAQVEPFSRHISSFSKLLFQDVWELLGKAD